MNNDQNFEINDPEIIKIHETLKKTPVPKANLSRQQRFKDELKRNLMFEYDKKVNKEHKPVYSNFILKIFNHAFVTAVLLPFIVLGAVSTYAYSSPSVYEGHTLFPVKIAIESMEYKMATMPEDKAEKKIKLAERRLDEAQAAYDDNMNISSETLSSIADYTLSAYQDLEKIDSEEDKREIAYALRDFSERQIEVLSEIGGEFNSEALAQAYEEEEDPVELFALVREEEKERSVLQDVEEYIVDDIREQELAEDLDIKSILDKNSDIISEDIIAEGVISEVLTDDAKEVATEILKDEDDKNEIMKKAGDMISNSFNMDVDEQVLSKAMDIVEEMVASDMSSKKEIEIPMAVDSDGRGFMGGVSGDNVIGEEISSLVAISNLENNIETEDVKKLISNNIYSQNSTVSGNVYSEKEALNYIWNVSNKLKNIRDLGTIQSEKNIYDNTNERLVDASNKVESLYMPRLKFYPRLDSYEIEKNVFLLEVKEGVSFYINESFVDSLGIEVPRSIFKGDVDIFMTNDNSDPFSSSTKQIYNSGYLLNIDRDITMKFVAVTDSFVSPVYTIQVSIIEGDVMDDEDVETRDSTGMPMVEDDRSEVIIKPIKLN